LTSMIKRVDNAVFETIRAVKENRFTPGEQVFGLKQGGVGLSEMKYTRDKVPPAVLEKLKKLEQKIIRGEITIPTRLEDLATFQPPEI
ncbi:MAG: BMP family ABC transporter substrate-binding protein, partial [Chthonomonadaceae bacterium]|nr:BMP family ABC transporter substrate-binding protein [Chthonomonadaceae bacterium]